MNDLRSASVEELVEQVRGGVVTHAYWAPGSEPREQALDELARRAAGFAAIRALVENIELVGTPEGERILDRARAVLAQEDNRDG